MIGSDALLDSAGPMTRRRRRELEASGLTPGGCSPIPGPQAGTARTLFSDRTNNLKQVAYPVGDGDSSPVQDWVKAANTTGACHTGDQNEPPLTPSLGLQAKVVLQSPLTDIVVGATPSNTPANGTKNDVYSPNVSTFEEKSDEEDGTYAEGTAAVGDSLPDTRPTQETSESLHYVDVQQTEELSLEKLRCELSKLEMQEEPADAGPYPEAPNMAIPVISSTSSLPLGGTPSLQAKAQETVNLDISGRDDILPTPGLFQQAATTVTKAINSPATPEDANYKPFSFSKSSGSFFATPEVPIKSGMTPMTSAADTRNAQKHIPVWNRISRMVAKQFPLVARQVEVLSTMPGRHPAWSHTPYMLLHSICTSKNWELTVRQETAARIGVESSVIATVNIPEESGEGQSLSAVGRNQGHLEALLLSASGVLEVLLQKHMISGKDASTAVSKAESSLLSGSVPVVVGNSLQFGTAPVPVTSKIMQKNRPPVPPVPQANRKQSYAAKKSDTEPNSCEESLSPHPGLGVRAIPGLCSFTPELVQVTPEPGTDPVTLGPKMRGTRSTQVSPQVYHPPMRTGTSPVNVSAKASISATARPVGLKALKEQQKEIERNMKKESAMLATLSKQSKKLVPKVVSLKGLPVPSGTHTTFGDTSVCTSEKRHQLRGVPAPEGSHIRFDD